MGPKEPSPSHPASRSRSVVSSQKRKRVDSSPESGNDATPIHSFKTMKHTEVDASDDDDEPIRHSRNHLKRSSMVNYAALAGGRPSSRNGPSPSTSGPRSYRDDRHDSTVPSGPDIFAEVAANDKVIEEKEKVCR